MAIILRSASPLTHSTYLKLAKIELLQSLAKRAQENKVMIVFLKSPAWIFKINLKNF